MRFLIRFIFHYLIRLIKFLAWLTWSLIKALSKVLWTLFSLFWTTLSPNTGLRTTRSWLLALGLTAFLFWLLTFMYGGDESFIRPMQLILLLASFFFIIKPLSLVIRKRRSITSIAFQIMSATNVVAIAYVTWLLLPISEVVQAYGLSFLNPLYYGEGFSVKAERFYGLFLIYAVLPNLVHLQNHSETLLGVVIVFGIGFITCYGFPLVQYAIEIFNEISPYRRWQTEEASSRWAGPGTFRKYPSRFKSNMTHDQIFLGVTRFEDNVKDRYVFTKDDASILTVGATGSGKAIVSAFPVLATYKHSMVVIDPKGEHGLFWAIRRHKLGNDVFILDPFGLLIGTHAERFRANYNHLLEFDIESETGRQRLAAYTSALIVVHNGTNKFWEEGAIMYLQGIIAYVLTKYGRDCWNLKFVLERMMGVDPITGTIDPELIKGVQQAMKKCKGGAGLPQIAASLLESVSESGRGYFVSEILNAVKWATDPALEGNIAKSDFKFSDFEKKKMTVFVVVPFGQLNEQKRWLKATVNLSMRIFENFKKKTKALYVLDELYQYGDGLKDLNKAAVSLRSAGIRMWAFLQHIGQVEAAFGRAGMNDFLSSSTIQIYGVRDDNTASWVSRILGTKLSVTKKGMIGFRKEEKHVVELMPASKVQTTFQKNARHQIIIPSEGNPMWLERLAFKDLKFEGRYFRSLPLEGLYTEPKSKPLVKQRLAWLKSKFSFQLPKLKKWSKTQSWIIKKVQATFLGSWTSLKMRLKENADN